MNPYQHYLDTAVRGFQHCRSLISRAVEQLEEAELHLAPAEGANPVAILLQHLAGNMMSRWTDIFDSDGEKPGRNREAEFQPQGRDKAALLSALEAGWAQVFKTLASLQPDDLERTLLIRGEAHTVLEAIHRQSVHYAYHTGQIVQSAKSMRGKDWRSLSVKSEYVKGFYAKS